MKVRFRMERVGDFITISKVRFLGLVGMCGLMLGCVPSKVHVQTAPEFNPFSISRVAVIPFHIREIQRLETGEIRGTVRDPEEIRTQFRLPGTDRLEVSRTSVASQAELRLAAERLTAKVMSVLGGRPFLQVVGPPLSSPSSFEEELGSSMARLAQTMGSALKVDGVIMGRLRTFREREGTKLGAQPAAVGFEMVLFGSKDGKVLWKGEYFEEQKPMTEDLVGFFEKGGGFVTAEELGDWGVKEVLETLPIGNEALQSSLQLTPRMKGKRS